MPCTCKKGEWLNRHNMLLNPFHMFVNKMFKKHRYKSLVEQSRLFAFVFILPLS